MKRGASALAVVCHFPRRAVGGRGGLTQQPNEGPPTKAAVRPQLETQCIRLGSSVPPRTERSGRRKGETRTSDVCGVMPTVQRAVQSPKITKYKTRPLPKVSPTCSGWDYFRESAAADQPAFPFISAIQRD
jgi:hypothetical protein